ncbi:MAG: NADH dehydrogenase [Deltaproteobacteria bacterium]|nr:NADH dehydrogenase [Deltaproteobacteria bacterium]
MSHVLLQTIIVPVIASLLILLSRPKTGWKAGWIAAFSLLYTSILLCLAGIKIYQGTTVYEEYPFVGIHMKLDLLADGLSLPVALIINLICTALAFYSIHYVEHRVDILYSEADKDTRLKYYTRYFILYLLFPTGFAGVCFTTNLLAMYFFLELLPIPLYFIMAYFGYIDRVRVALMCLLWGVIGASLFLVGSLLAYFQTGSFQISELHTLVGNPMTVWIILLFLLCLSTKLAIFPLHVWMPWVHAEHPTCIAGLLAVYANLGAYILVRIIILPIHADFKVFSIPLMIMVLVTMVYGSLLAMAQTDVKRLAACSTISQISYSILGLAAATTVSIEGGMFFFLSHIMGKTIFFSTAGILVYVTGIRDMRQMGGLASKMPITALLWIMGSMMLSGFPPFSSFAAEWIMFTGIFKFGVYTVPVGLIIALLGVSAIILTISYTFWSAKKIFFGPLRSHLSKSDIKDPPLTMSIPLLLLALTSLILCVYPKLIMDIFHNVIGKL